MTHDHRPTTLPSLNLGNWVGPLPGRRPLPPITAPLLLLVDWQRLFCDPGSPAFLTAWPLVEPNSLRLRDFFTAAGRPTAYTRHVHHGAKAPWPLSHFFPRKVLPIDPLSELVPAANCHDADCVIIEKELLDAFTNPALAEMARHADALIIAGVQTHRCVLATALGAAARGLLPVVVADACAAPTATMHQAALSVLAAGHAHVCLTDELIGHLTRDPSW